MDGFNKVVIVSLCDKLTKEIAKALAQSLDMMFCDTQDLIEYELIDQDKLKKISSKEYMDMQERKVLMHIASFEGVTVAINYDYLVRHFDILKDRSLVVFLMLSKTYVRENSNSIDYISFEKRSNNLQKIANFTLNIRKTDVNYVCLKIIDKLGENL